MIFTNLIDRLACAWLDWRQNQNIEQLKRDMPEMAEEFRLHSAEIRNGKLDLAIMHPAIYVMADEAAAFLKDNGARNYVQFDMMPRLDRGLRPIRVTVQWADGEMPASKASRLERELAELRKVFESA